MRKAQSTKKEQERILASLYGKRIVVNSNEGAHKHTRKDKTHHISPEWSYFLCDFCGASDALPFALLLVSILLPVALLLLVLKPCFLTLLSHLYCLTLRFLDAMIRTIQEN